MACAKSYYRMSMVAPAFRLKYYMKTSTDSVGVDLSNLNKVMRADSNLTIGVLLVAVKIASYLDLRRRGFDVSALRYEDLIAQPLDMCRVVLEFCHLPVSLAELAVKAFDVDSQVNSEAAKSAVGHFKEPQLTPQMKTELNAILKQLGVPLIGEPNVIEGTLSCG